MELELGQELELEEELKLEEELVMEEEGHEDQLKIDCIDVRRAFFHAKCRWEVFVELPPEDAEPGVRGKLNMAMYGTHDAPQNCEFEYGELMESIGFRKGKATPCFFYHEARNVRFVVYGDDFTVLGNDKSLDWFRKRIKGRYEVELKARLGGTRQDDKAAFLLNRPIEWNTEGISYEADQTHVEIMLRDLNLDSHSKGLTYLYERLTAKDLEYEPPELEPRTATMYRAAIASANYLSQDRSDIRYAIGVK